MGGPSGQPGIGAILRRAMRTHRLREGGGGDRRLLGSALQSRGAAPKKSGREGGREGEGLNQLLIANIVYWLNSQIIC